jgi:5'-deoxynucleotidase YfbR-like HD superfamily hydrolase
MSAAGDYLPNVDPARIGDWMQTYSGRCFWPLDPRPEDVCIGDIAHSLALRCRYGGHCKRFYSVAEHSVLVSLHVPTDLALWGLLHDAAEAYSADVPRPLKRCIPEWKLLEARIMAAVCERFGLHPEEPKFVKYIDMAITSDERDALMSPCERDWGDLPPPIGAAIVGLHPEAAEAYFLNRFAALYRVRISL